MLDLLLLVVLGFLGSFGHCVGMCGPLAAAFSLSQRQEMTRWQQLRFHILLNIGRIVSYALIGAGIGAVGSVVIAGGQLAGVGSVLRRCISLLTGGLLVWFGLVQVSPALLPKIPMLNPMAQNSLQQRLNQAMIRLSLQHCWWTPALLGMAWGLIPCGFLYAAQIKAAETGSLGLGSLTMLAFGLGTLPMMLTVGVTTGLLSQNRRSQLFRVGGWITLTIGILTLMRSGDMVDYTGHASLICLTLVLIARPVSRLWASLLQYRRVLGVGAFIFAWAHIAHMLTMGWSLQALPFLLPSLQIGGWAGIIAIVLMTPLALTSFDLAQKKLGKHWRQLHLLSVPIFGLAIVHTILLGSHYLGSFEATWKHQAAAVGLGIIAVLVFLVRWRWFWSLLCLERFYDLPHQNK